MSSPPLTPIRNYMASPNTSPRQRRPLSRRSSSFTGNQSPIARRPSYSDHRLSDASRFSNGTDELESPIERSNGQFGMGTLADELDSETEEWYEDGMMEESTELCDNNSQQPITQTAQHSTPIREPNLREPPRTDGARDSGVDIGYDTPSPLIVKFYNGPLQKASKRQSALISPSSQPSSDASNIDADDRFSIELEDAMAAIAKLAAPTTGQHPDTSARTIAALQDLAAQTALETHSHRLATSMNSLSTNMAQQTRLLASISSALFSRFSVCAPLEQTDIENLLVDLSAVLQELPLPDARALQGLSKLDRDNAELLHTLSALLDSVQMGKQTTTSAARHLRSTQTMVSQLKHEMEKAEEAHSWLEKGDWDQRLKDRWCASECQDVVSGFDKMCDGLRKTIEEGSIG